MRNTLSRKDYYQSTLIHWDFAKTVFASEIIVFFSFVDWSGGLTIDCPWGKSIAG